MATYVGAKKTVDPNTHAETRFYPLRTGKSRASGSAVLKVSTQRWSKDLGDMVWRR
jgi:hypothetical protein